MENLQTGTGSGNFDRVLYVGSNGKLIFGECCFVTITSSSTVTDGNWHHAVATQNGSAQALYLDGVSQGTASGAAGNYTGYWRIGGGTFGGWPNYGGSYVSGNIDEVGIWNVALTSAQVTTLYNSGAGNAFNALVCPTVINSASGFSN